MSPRDVYTRKTPLGYAREGDRLVEVESEQRLVRRIIAMRSSGLSLQKIAGQINADGITGKEGGRFYASTIQKIVGNEIHA